MTEDEIEEIKKKAIFEIANALNRKDLEEIKIEYLGRKKRLNEIIRRIKDLPIDKRPLIGQLANKTKREIEEQLKRREKELPPSRYKLPSIDVTMPPAHLPYGRIHPITQMSNQIIDVFIRLGFEIVEGPEVEYSSYNFDALNILPDHPARDMHDTFYIEDSEGEVLLRTHTSPVQIRIMKEHKPPLRIVVPGKVYRRDADISHSPMFHQVEGLLVDNEVSFADLKGVLNAFLHEIFKGVEVRFRPSFFPFTEPSVEVDIRCTVCGGTGCRVCKGTGWLEILGAGMVDPEVFKNVGYDPEDYLGFAFGLGVERLCILKHGIDDIRLFFENDLRFLDQF
ncbi:TPA: phenylalanine--tRNA ligase subunit alpha [bacterium]|nr:phenylalanine--tRNA ligase subunit alpha [bacterium]